MLYLVWEDVIHWISFVWRVERWTKKGDWLSTISVVRHVTWATPFVSEKFFVFDFFKFDFIISCFFCFILLSATVLFILFGSEDVTFFCFHVNVIDLTDCLSKNASSLVLFSFVLFFVRCQDFCFNANTRRVLDVATRDQLVALFSAVRCSRQPVWSAFNNKLPFPCRLYSSSLLLHNKIIPRNLSMKIKKKRDIRQIFLPFFFWDDRGKKKSNKLLCDF